MFVVGFHHEVNSLSLHIIVLVSRYFTGRFGSLNAMLDVKMKRKAVKTNLLK